MIEGSTRIGGHCEKCHLRVAMGSYKHDQMSNNNNVS